MEGLILALVAGLVGLGAGWILAKCRSQGALRDGVEALATELERGVVRAPGPEDPPSIALLRRALGSGWSPRSEVDASGSGAVLGRVASYLRTGVATPLTRGLEGDDDLLRKQSRVALDAVDDLLFYSEFEPVADRRHENLTRLVQDVMREFAEEFDTPVRLRAPDAPVRAPLDPEAFKDALYMLLVNAGRFGGHGAAVELELEERGGQVRLSVRDRGAGFTPDALERAMEPFYSTDSGSLGMGLTHVRQVVMAHGGDVTLRNREDGGG